MTPRLRRLHPDPAGVTDIRTEYDVERPRPADRPWVAVVMVNSLDGSAVVDGASGGLGNPNDLEVLLTLRDVADVIIVGAGTARSEGYGPPRRPGQRIGLVTNSGNVDLDSELFTSGSGFVIAPASAPIDDAAVDVIRAGDSAVDLVVALRSIQRLVEGATFVCAEGGPRLNGSLLDAGLTDELDLTTSPRIVGGTGPRITVGAHDITQEFDLAHLLVDDENFVFSRWIRR